MCDIYWEAMGVERERERVLDLFFLCRATVWNLDRTYVPTLVVREKISSFWQGFLPGLEAINTNIMQYNHCFPSQISINFRLKLPRFLYLRLLNRCLSFRLLNRLWGPKFRPHLTAELGAGICNQKAMCSSEKLWCNMWISCWFKSVTLSYFACNDMSWRTYWFCLVFIEQCHNTKKNKTCLVISHSGW